MRILILILLANVVFMSPARASQLAGAAGMTCEGSSHVVTVSGTYYWGIEGEYTKIVLKRQSVGVCEPDELLMAEALPFETEPAVGYAADYSLTFEVSPPRLDVVYRYVPYGVKSDGSLHLILHNCDADSRGYALTNCGDVPFDRGTFVFSGVSGGTLIFGIFSCEDDCWNEGVFGEYPLEEMEVYCGEPPMDLIGEVVDVYGGRAYCAMIGGPYEYITRIERAPSGVCGPVPVRETSWGSFKSMFR